MVKIRIEMSNPDEMPRVIEQVYPEMYDDITSTDMRELFEDCLRGLSYVIPYDFECREELEEGEGDDDESEYEDEYDPLQNLKSCCSCSFYQSDICDDCVTYKSYKRGCPRNCENCEVYDDYEADLNYSLCNQDLERRLALREKFMEKKV